jgi:hypothetical protein
MFAGFGLLGLLETIETEGLVVFVVNRVIAWESIPSTSGQLQDIYIQFM